MSHSQLPSSNEDPKIPDDFWPLLDAACDDALSPEDRDRFEHFIESNAAARRVYVAHIRVRTQIRLWHKGERSRNAGLAAANSGQKTVDSGQWIVDSEKSQAASDRRSEIVIPSESSLPTTHYPLSTQLPREPVASIFSRTSWGEYVVPCLASAGIMIVIGFGLWMWKLSDARSPLHFEPSVAKKQADDDHLNASQSDENGAEKNAAATAVAKPVYVGRITAEADCRWTRGNREWRMADDKASGGRKSPVRETDVGIKQGANAPRSPSLVAFGEKITVAAGLLEITFDSGAKVILEGPCRFNVEKNGGFLAVGRLTGKMEKSGSGSAKPQAASDQKSLATNHQPLATKLSTTHYPLSTSFVIATPTAIVTDLGTEFGVEVDTDGCTSSHVFQGCVEIRPKVADNRVEQMLRLTKDESAKIALNHKHNPVIYRVAAKADRSERFVRQVPPRRPILLFEDTFDNRQPCGKYLDGGLNQELSRRQFGLWRGAYFWVGGSYGNSQSDFAQVNPPLAPGKLSLCADYCRAGWTALNRNFPRNVSVSAELSPVAVHWPDKAKPDVFTRENAKNRNWICLAVRCSSIEPANALLPLSTNAGATLVIRPSGNWEYFENGERIAVGDVPQSSSYRVFMQVSGDQLAIHVNETPLNLDANALPGKRTLHGMAAATEDNFIAIGVDNAGSLGHCNEASKYDVNGRDLHTVDNLTISTIYPSGHSTDKPAANNKTPTHSIGPQ